MSDIKDDRIELLERQLDCARRYIKILSGQLELAYERHAKKVAKLRKKLEIGGSGDEVELRARVALLQAELVWHRELELVARDVAVDNADKLALFWWLQRNPKPKRPERWNRHE